MAQLLLNHGADANSQDEFSRADRVAAVKRMTTSESMLCICLHLYTTRGYRGNVFSYVSTVEITVTSKC